MLDVTLTIHDGVKVDVVLVEVLRRPLDVVDVAVDVNAPLERPVVCYKSVYKGILNACRTKSNLPLNVLAFLFSIESAIAFCFVFLKMSNLTIVFCTFDMPLVGSFIVDL